MFKNCPKCKEKKSLNDFYKNKKNRDELSCYCKNCINIQYKIYNLIHQDKIKIQRAKYRLTKKYRKSLEKYRQSSKGKETRNKLRKIYRKKNSLKHKAHFSLENAVSRNEIIKPDRCEDCKKLFPKHLIHGHHEDYSKPIDVIWLCYKCHISLHKHKKQT